MKLARYFGDQSMSSAPHWNTDDHAIESQLDHPCESPTSFASAFQCPRLRSASCAQGSPRSLGDRGWWFSPEAFARSSVAPPLILRITMAFKCENLLGRESVPEHGSFQSSVPKPSLLSTLQIIKSSRRIC
jgi:hypothetical protein